MSKIDRGRKQALHAGHDDNVAELPGFVRGLTLYDCFAFVGLSKIQETSIFGGLPISEKRSELKCRVFVLDIITGKTVAFVEIEKSVEEIFDVQNLAGIAATSGIIGACAAAIDNFAILGRRRLR